MNNKNFESRRKFLKDSTLIAAGSALAASLNLGLVSNVHAQGSDMLKIALIGAGGRGTGAVDNCLSAAKLLKQPVKLVAVADAFEGNARRAIKALKEDQGWKDAIDVADDHVFVGLDAYKKAVQLDVDMILTAAPPGFRPFHYKAAVDAGKHVFMEKPCCVDAPGYRSLVETNAQAEKKGLKVGVGLQRHHDKGYVNGITQIHDGKLGDLVLLQAWWNGDGIWWRDPQEGWSEMRKQVNNWYHYVWLSGDNICEQHIHNLDVCNWAKGAHPVKANGMGGDQVRRAKNAQSQIFDHHFVEFTYPDDEAMMYSQCRHVPNTFSKVTEYAWGTKGKGPMTADGNEKDVNGVDFLSTNPFVQEHVALIEAVRRNLPYHEGRYGAESSMTAVLGRMATYSGKEVTWDEAVEKGKPESVGMEDFTWDTTPPVVPDKDGIYPRAIPGSYDPFV
jgi:predicted dehydrogenase